MKQAFTAQVERTGVPLKCGTLQNKAATLVFRVVDASLCDPSLQVVRHDLRRHTPEDV